MIERYYIDMYVARMLLLCGVLTALDRSRVAAQLSQRSYGEPPPAHSQVAAPAPLVSETAVLLIVMEALLVTSNADRRSVPLKAVRGESFFTRQRLSSPHTTKRSV